MKKLHLPVFFSLISTALLAQTASPITGDQPLGFEEYDPISTLKVAEHKLGRSKFPFIDVHNHQFGMPKQDLKKLLADMDALNMAVMINLSGRGGDSDENTARLGESFANISKNAPRRVAIFTNVAFDGVGAPGWTEKALKLLEEDIKRGAKGLKVYKNLGFNVKDSEGKLVPVDDPRLDPIWKKCGELGVPVLIHTADPRPFWDPLDRYNERWLELKLNPRRKRGSQQEFTWEQLIEQQHHLFRKNPKTKFIAAHMGWYPHNLSKLDSLLTAMPNMNVEIGAVIAELGRQPRTGKKFFEKYQDRILFGKDSWVPSEYATYFRVLETEDEYFPYHKKYHAFWRMYGLGLSDAVLKKVYYKNALRLIPGLDKTQFPE
ncbi:MAG: amidohydrolase [Cytophagaceae bacterium]|nr:amidohydrolase [Cytophagaceae bacterium]